VRAPDGEVLLRTGGVWDRTLRRYVPPPPDRTVRIHSIALKLSQVDAGRALARWFSASRQGDRSKPIVMMLAGDRGSGKTWFLAGVAVIAVGLEWPSEYQFCVNITTPQRRECIESMQEVVAPGWITEHKEDFRDPWTTLITGSKIGWFSSRNPKRLRQAKLRIRHVFINEGQDQPERVYFNAVGATRNVDGLTTIATNRPQEEAGDWVAVVASAIDAGEIDGELHLLDPKLNDAVDPISLDKRAKAIRAVSREAADADAGGGGMRVSGPLAYPAFRPIPILRGGHLGDPPPTPDIGRPLWRDVTREVTAQSVPESAGWDYVVGVDFQRRPGIIGIAHKLYRVERVWDLLSLAVGTLVLWCCDYIGTPGEEEAFSSALERRGYTPKGYTPEGAPAPSALLVGDGTGARQNAAHRWELPPSYVPLRADGWTVLPPWKTRRGKPDNPPVKESRAQMHALFFSRQVLISPRLKEPDPGFPSLSESFTRAKVTVRGQLMERGGWQHGPDGVRYVAFRFMPRPQPPRAPNTLDHETFDALSKIRLTHG